MRGRGGAGEWLGGGAVNGPIYVPLDLKTLGIVLGKVALYAAALVPVALFFPRDLIWCGVGISSVLVIGAFIINVLMRRGGKGER